MKIKTILLFIYIASIPTPSLGNSFLPQEWNVESKNLVKLGQGFRTATWFNVKVYEAAIYAEKAEPLKIFLESNQIKAIRMKFFRDVPRNDSIKVWKDSLNKNCAKPCKVNIDSFLNAVKEIKVNDTHSYVFKGNSVTVSQGKNKITLDSPGLSNLLLRTWIGKYPPTTELKDALTVKLK